MKTSRRIAPSSLVFAVVALLIVFSGNGVPAGTIEGKLPASEQYWNQFHGPNGDNRALATGLPIEFSETHNIRWKTAIHDRGWSSPVVWGEQIWVTTAREDGKELFAVCVDLNNGRIIHDIKVFDVARPQLEFSDLNSHATPTAVVEDRRVYVHFGTYGTACLDTKTGKKLWERRDLNCDHVNRGASSPIVDGNALFLTFDGADVQFAVALDKNTGETLWLRNREIESDYLGALKEGLGKGWQHGMEKQNPG